MVLNMEWTIGVITIIGLIIGILTLIKGNKKMEIMQLVLTIIFHVATLLWCHKKNQFVFGGTNFEFIIQTATVDKMIEPYLIFLLFIILIVLIGINVFKLIRKEKI